jgi:hypothetical protein
MLRELLLQLVRQLAYVLPQSQLQEEWIKQRLLLMQQQSPLKPHLMQLLKLSMLLTLQPMLQTSLLKQQMQQQSPLKKHAMPLMQQLLLLKSLLLRLPH